MLYVLESGLMLFDISMKSHEDILNGSQVIVWYNLGENRHTDAHGKKNMLPYPEGDRQNFHLMI